MLRRRRCCSKEPTAIRNLTIPPPAPLWHRRISRWFPRVTSSWPSFPRLTVKPSGTLSFEPTGGAVSLAYLGERLARLEERGVKIALGPASITFGGQNRAVLVGSHSTTLRNCGELIQQPSGSMAMNSVVANFANSSKASSFTQTMSRLILSSFVNWAPFSFWEVIFVLKQAHPWRSEELCITHKFSICVVASFFNQRRSQPRSGDCLNSRG